jgi:hypothetical protein
MKANELRIGNWILNTRYKSGYEMQIESIGQFGINIELGYDGLNPIIDDDCSFNECEPIPLTEEWLLKFGFERKGITSCFGKLCIHHKEPMYPNGRVYFNSWAILQKMPEHVHQLQNLYFALTGEELITK